jgi:hypothetical protein
MKRIALLITMFLLIAAFAVAQNTTKITPLAGGGKLIYINQVVASTGTYNSPAFTLDGFLENTVTYPIAVQYSVDTSDVTSGTDVDSVSVVFRYSNDPDVAAASWAVADTISLTLGTTALTAATYDLNGKKGAYWRVQTIGKGANTGAAVKVFIYAYRKDH